MVRTPSLDTPAVTENIYNIYDLCKTNFIKPYDHCIEMGNTFDSFWTNGPIFKGHTILETSECQLSYRKGPLLTRLTTIIMRNDSILLSLCMNPCVQSQQLYINIEIEYFLVWTV